MNDIERVNHLISQRNLIGQTGVISFNYAGFTATIKSKDVVGNIVQEWLGHWLNAQGMVWETRTHTQSWPDFVLNDRSHLEVKSFDSEAGPNFDVANFDAFVRSLWIGEVHRLDTPYLVFSYVSNQSTGVITLNNYWFKNIWELTGPSNTNILNLQVKQGTATNIRPKNWRSARVQTFGSRQEFVYALSQAVTRFSQIDYPDWYLVVKDHYEQQFNRPL